MYLTHKHLDLSSISGATENPGMVAWACNAGLGEAGTGRSSDTTERLFSRNKVDSKLREGP